MLIKAASPEHFDKVMEFYYNLIDDMQDSKYHPGWEKDIYPTRQFIHDAIGHGELYTAIDDNAIVGAMVINHDCAEEYTNVRWKINADRDQVAVIHILGVSARYQSRGIGKKMVAYAADISKEKGIKAIRLEVLASNVPALRLYASMGFLYMDTLQLFFEDTGLTDFHIYELTLE